MRITAKVASVASAGVARIPVPSIDIDECYNAADANYDEGLLRKSLNVEGITFSSHENKATLLFAIELLKQVESVTNQVNSASEDRVDERGQSRSATVNKSIKKLNRGNRIGYVRLQVDWVGDHLRATVSCANPGESAVGSTDIFLRRYSVLCARTIDYLAVEFGRNGTRIEKRDGAGCSGVFAEAEEMNRWFDRRAAELKRVRDLNNKRFGCPHYRNGMCCALPDGTPPEFGCGCFRAGCCEEAKPASEFANEEESKW